MARLSVSRHRVPTTARWPNQAVVVLAALVAGLATVPPRFLSAQLGPTLILEDSVVLRETDEHHVGQPVSLIPVGDGSFLIADGYSNSVLHFDSRGRHQRTFGQKGDGPGEFGFVSYAGFVAGDVVGIGDDRVFELELFDLRSAAHIGAVRMSALVDEYAVRGDTIWFGGVNTENWTSVGSAEVDDLVAVASSVLRVERESGRHTALPRHPSPHSRCGTAGAHVAGKSAPCAGPATCGRRSTDRSTHLQDRSRELHR